MQTYDVTWSISIDADSPLEAAREALRIQRDRTSIATYFEVWDTEQVCHAVDLLLNEED